MISERMLEEEIWLASNQFPHVQFKLLLLVELSPKFIKVTNDKPV